MKNLLLASTSTLHPTGYLDYILPELDFFLKEIQEILFIPYAQPSGISLSEYTQIAQNAFSKIEKKVVGIHTFENKRQAVLNAKAIFVGGGNSFLLLDTLYKEDLIASIREACEGGTLYFGTSAGTNLAGKSIKNTNDMPIVYPPSFEALGLVDFNFNPHYLDPDPKSTHKGETRETRIFEFHKVDSTPVVGLREGSFLRVKEGKILLKGEFSARIFTQNNEPYELEPNRFLVISV